MPIYVSLDTIKRGMCENASHEYTQWKVFDQDENLMNTFKGLATTTSGDSFSNLESFLEPMAGEGYVIIKAYPKGMKLGAGGDTSNVLKFNYRLKGGGGTPFSGGGGSGISLEMFLNQMNENNKLQMELLTEKLTKKESKNLSAFERVASKMGMGFAKEYMKKEGLGDIDDDDDDDDEEEKKPVKKKSSETVTEKPADKEEIKSAFKRTGTATVDIMRTAKKMGSNYEEVAESFEEIAAMAKKDPLKLKKLFDSLKKK